MTISNPNKIKLALLYGGTSDEREVSLNTGEQIFQALDKNKYQIIKYDTKTDLRQFCEDVFDKKIDLVFPALHGTFGEDGKLQGMLDMLGVPYLFSGCLASALAMNKYQSKVIAKNAGLKVAEDIVLFANNSYNISEIVEKMSLPIVVKPIEAGSSVGISIVKTESELKQGIEDAFKHDNKILLEKYIKGRELTVPVWNNPPVTLPIIEIIPKISGFYDYKAKYQTGGSEHICPAKISDEIKDQINKYSLDVFKAIGCEDLARVDFILSEGDNQLYFLEINTIPGMTKTSLTPESAKVAGIEFKDFLDQLIQLKYK